MLRFIVVFRASVNRGSSPKLSIVSWSIWTISNSISGEMIQYRVFDIDPDSPRPVDL
jgi:hypothetical protein